MPICAPSALPISKIRCEKNLATDSRKPSTSGRIIGFGFRARSLRAGRRGFLSAVPLSAVTSSAVESEESMSADVLKRFIFLNIGKWNGSFYQFDANGDMLQSISTKLSATSYGEGDLISLIQTLYIKQPPASLIIDSDDETEWVEYKIKETNLFTVDKYQQIGFFPTEKAFSLRYQTAGMLETVLRAGVLGDDDIGDESPRNLKLPSRHPSVVCESCLYSLNKDMRARAFHIMDPGGVLDTLLIFLEQRDEAAPCILSCGFLDDQDKISLLLGQWNGLSITKRSGIYGATIEKAETVTKLEVTRGGQLIHEFSSLSYGSGATTNVNWRGKISRNIINYDGGFHVTILPGGMYMGFPCDIFKSVAQSQSFHLEFCWMESPEKRQRLVRTYDTDGLAVSSTYILETKV